MSMINMEIFADSAWYFWVKGATTDTRTEFYGRGG